MLVTDYALRHRTTVFVLIFLIFVVGMVSYLLLPREAAPDVKIPTIMVIVPYPGVSPEDIESLVTTPLEAELEDLRDLDESKSISSEGMALVYLTFLPDVDITEASQRVRDRVNRARTKIPSEIQEPVVQEISSSDWPVLMISISGDAGLVKLKRIGEDLKQEIEAIEGVLEVDVAGGLEREIRVELNPHLLNSYGLSLGQVTSALANENVNIPGGGLDVGTIKYTLRIPEEIEDPDKILDLVVETKFGYPVRIRDIGKVVDGYKERTTASRYRGREGVSLRVKKQSGANIINMVESIKSYVTDVSERFPPGTQIVYLNDYSKHIQDMVHELENNIVTALVLVMAVLFLFIGGRNAFFVALAVPFSMLVSFIILSAMGVTLNMVVLFSLILALGMLVDNAIVIVENIYRHTRTSDTLLQAALEGTQEVGWPVITSTMTTVSVFIPLLAWPGVMGEFMSYLPLTLIVTLSSSLFVALVINPVLASVFMKPEKASDVEKKENKFKESKFVGGYRKVLEFSLRFSWLIAPLMVAILVGSGALYFGSNPMVEFMPSSTPDKAAVTIRAPEGTRLEETDRMSTAVEEALESMPNVKHSVAELGVGGQGMSSSGEGSPYLEIGRAHV